MATPIRMDSSTIAMMTAGAGKPKQVTRNDFKSMKRILVKLGTSIIIHTNGRVALGRIGNLVEQIAKLVARGYEVIVVSSGAVGIGKQRLRQQSVLSQSLRTHVHHTDTESLYNDKACAAAGQSGLMALYESMFGAYDLSVAQVLVTDHDFASAERRHNLSSTIDQLLKLQVVPIINENDVITLRTTPLLDDSKKIFWDNDSLACLVAAETRVDVAFLLTDVDGLYENPPGSPETRLIETFSMNSTFTFGEKSRVGRGGMQTKVSSAQSALERGVQAVVICSGYKQNTVLQLMDGENLGTLFVLNPGPDLKRIAIDQTIGARKASQALQQLTGEQRSAILQTIADNLISNEARILEANDKDILNAEATTMTSSLKARLKLSSAKIQTLAEGIRNIAKDDDPIGKILRKTKLAENLILEQRTIPLGVLLVIFESRPDVLPQIAALAIRSGNGLLLKGGSEAEYSNRVLHEIVIKSIETASGNRVSRDLIALVHSRQEVASLLSLDRHIDLVIPRGSNQLVSSIQKNTRIPVLGHAEGICHVYVDKDACLEMAIRLIIDAKTDYPAACNAMETLLIHRDLVENGNEAGAMLINALKKEDVKLFGCPRAARLFQLAAAPSFRREYSSLAATVVIVDSVQEAMQHIEEFGSQHTDAIVTENKDAAQQFLSRVDSACVFHNASTRFSDGYRFGLGAEVGISTGKIHARGPVGVDGLTTTKWILVSDDHTHGHIVNDFSSGKLAYKHEKIISKL